MVTHMVTHIVCPDVLALTGSVRCLLAKHEFRLNNEAVKETAKQGHLGAA